MARTCGLPFTWLKSMTGPPSRCFCTPVISRSGSTSTSVLNTSPCVSNHSNAERSEVISFLTFLSVSSANTVAMISLLLYLCRTNCQFVVASWTACATNSRERAFLQQHFILTPRQTQPINKHFFVVCSQARRGAAHAAGRLIQFVRNHAVGVITHFRMLLLLPDVSKSNLRIGKQVLDRVNFCRVNSADLQTPHQMFGGMLARPGADQLIEFSLIFFSLRKCDEASVRQPRALFRGVTKTLPFLIVPTTYDAPLIIRAGITAMRRGHSLAIAVTICDPTV